MCNFKFMWQTSFHENLMKDTGSDSESILKWDPDPDPNQNISDSAFRSALFSFWAHLLALSPAVWAELAATAAAWLPLAAPPHPPTAGICPLESPGPAWASLQVSPNYPLMQTFPVAGWRWGWTPQGSWPLPGTAGWWWGWAGASCCWSPGSVSGSQLGPGYSRPSTTFWLV